MELRRFRVTNFRSVEDSGWIEADDVTALIGTNESGKTGPAATVEAEPCQRGCDQSHSGLPAQALQHVPPPDTEAGFHSGRFRPWW